MSNVSEKWGGLQSQYYIDGTVVLVDLYAEVVPDGCKVVWLRKMTQPVVFHRILQYYIEIPWSW